MSSTRRAAEDADPNESNERHLANARLRGLGVGLNIVCRVARVLPRAEREAMIFLTNYARLCDLTAEDVAAELRLPQFEIRESLTNPDHDRAGFVRQVSKVREHFNAELDAQRKSGEASEFALVPAFDEAAQRIADTSIARKISNAFRMCAGIPQIVEIVGKSRMGKSIAARREYLRNLHRAAWLTCPRGGTERDWLNAIAGALGMSFSSAQKNGQIMPKIEACFGRARIELLVVDEGHRLAPVEQDAEPRRLEFLRDLWELRGVAVVVLATPQYTTALGALMAGNPRWAPAQWLGRVQQFKLPDTMTAKDLVAVARHHAPDADEDAIALLVKDAKANEGFCGAVVATIRRARFREDGGRLSLTAISEAQRQLARTERGSTFATGKTVPFSRRRGACGPATGHTAAGGSIEPPGSHPPTAVSIR